MGSRGKVMGAVDTKPRKGATACWTDISGCVVRGFSITDLARKLDLKSRTLSMAINAARRKGLHEVVTLGYLVHFEDPVSAEKGHEPDPVERKGGPLLPGRCTHRLGAYRGGDW